MWSGVFICCSDMLDISLAVEEPREIPRNPYFALDSRP
jgi:hypothetical protein